jgi:hypothetical protein
MIPFEVKELSKDLAHIGLIVNNNNTALIQLGPFFTFMIGLNHNQPP